MVRTDAALVDDPRVSRVFVHVLAVLHHHAVAVLTGRSEDLETFVTATREFSVICIEVGAVFPGASVLLATISVLLTFVHSC